MLPHDKQALIAFIQSLPDDLEVVPFEYREIVTEAEPWAGTGQQTYQGGTHERNVHHGLTLRLAFKTRERMYFQRTYTEPDGVISGLHRVPRNELN